MSHKISSKMDHTKIKATNRNQKIRNKKKLPNYLNPF